MRLLSSFMVGLILAAAALWGAPRPALADFIVLPPGIERGEQFTFRLAFVTSTTTTATSGDIGFYNDFVNDTANGFADLAAFGFTWKAIVSTLAIDARGNTATRPSFSPGGSLGVPIFLLDGTKLADSYDDLWDGSLDAPFNIAEDGTAITSGPTIVGTGTSSNGGLFPGRPNGANFPEIGRILSTDASWVQFDSSLPTTERRIYALSDVIFFAIPAPPPLGLMIYGLATLAVMRRKPV